MSDYKNEPAFPQLDSSTVLNPDYPTDVKFYSTCGITRLEWFAAAALQGLLAAPSTRGGVADFAKMAFEQAEAMCNEYEKIRRSH